MITLPPVPKLGPEQLVHETQWRTIVSRGVPANPEIGEWEYLKVGSRVGAELSQVLSLTPDGHLVLVCLYRPAIGTFHMELPGGWSREGETNEQAVERELVQETGFRPEHIVSIGGVSSDAGLVSNLAHLYLATECELVAEPDRDGWERAMALQTVIVPQNELFLRQEGLIWSPNIAHALALAQVMGFIQPLRSQIT